MNILKAINPKILSVFLSLTVVVIITLFTAKETQAHQNAGGTCYHAPNQWVECCGANYCSPDDVVNDCTLAFVDSSGNHSSYSTSVDLHQTCTDSDGNQCGCTEGGGTAACNAMPCPDISFKPFCPCDDTNNYCTGTSYTRNPKSGENCLASTCTGTLNPPTCNSPGSLACGQTDSRSNQCGSCSTTGTYCSSGSCVNGTCQSGSSPPPSPPPPGCTPNCNDSGNYCSGSNYTGNCGQSCAGTKTCASCSCGGSNQNCCSGGQDSQVCFGNSSLCQDGLTCQTGTCKSGGGGGCLADGASCSQDSQCCGGDCYAGGGYVCRTAATCQFYSIQLISPINNVQIPYSPNGVAVSFYNKDNGNCSSCNGRTSKIYLDNGTNVVATFQTGSSYWGDSYGTTIYPSGGFHSWAVESGCNSNSSLKQYTPSWGTFTITPADFTLNTPTTSCSGSQPRVDLSWSASGGAAGYEVRYLSGGSWAWLRTITSPPLSYTDFPPANTSRTYIIRAYVGSSEKYSNSISVTPNCNPPIVDLKVRKNGTSDAFVDTSSASPLNINGGYSAYLSWSSTNAGSCTGSASHSGNSWADSNWDTSQNLSGTNGTTTLPASADNYLYTLTCTNTSGSASDTVYIKATNAILPWVQFNGDVHSNTRIDLPLAPSEPL